MSQEWQVRVGLIMMLAALIAPFGLKLSGPPLLLLMLSVMAGGALLFSQPRWFRSFRRSPSRPP